MQLLLKPPYPINESDASRDRNHYQANYNYNETNEKSSKSGKNQLEEIISILKENYEKEIELMESSYRLNFSDYLMNLYLLRFCVINFKIFGFQTADNTYK